MSNDKRKYLTILSFDVKFLVWYYIPIINEKYQKIKTSLLKEMIFLNLKNDFLMKIVEEEWRS